ncbi:Gfo/Idh/MocA family protein NDAI_0B01120 [Naumovozyma dairenensis CBS 421]|uniref:Uncharacterized protein n=1 Tax=Naumovozyma dairenensis (strain ATCC 10597 / BCRC 20456 / CBS 421 / NBRC 0211 / NRRL Y-12639) TaxID=1071378 RepID=G0W5T5_NAUDC|nr:hypothetical protein NDAI_0B01120 [Naumovozyma dairenensis CBS 421]CCD23146.1 hypothetical protein NDAI_0B01120 [Naumovozyma dairenensis CBS 421]
MGLPTNNIKSNNNSNNNNGSNNNTGISKNRIWKRRSLITNKRNSISGMTYNLRSKVSTIPNTGSIKVGFVGLSFKKGWALKTHYPAILQLSSQFEITALYNPTIDSSISTIRELKLRNATAFPTIESFASSSGVDMIVISIENMNHYEIIMSLLKYSQNNANLKYLFVEWGLKCSEKELETICAETTKNGIQTIISLQGRKSPYILRAKELIAQGYIGEINSIEVAGNGGWYGYERPQKSPAYMFDIKNGTNLVTTTFGHTIDVLQYITSSYFSTINAMVINNIPEQELVDDFGNKIGQKAPKTVPDHLLFQGTLLNGNVPVSCSIKGGKPIKKFTKNLVIDIHGTKGDIKLEGDAGFVEITNLVLYYGGIKPNNSPIYKTSDREPTTGDSGKETMEVYHLRNYNALVGNIFRLYQSIADFHFNTKQIENLPSQFAMQEFEFEGFPTLMDALFLVRLIDNVYKSNDLGSTLDVSKIYQYP